VAHFPQHSYINYTFSNLADFYPKNGGCRFFSNVGNNLKDYEVVSIIFGTGADICTAVVAV
jgi:hypothetical protein